jgi:peptide alpha-N-acetyltransferase
MVKSTKPPSGKRRDEAEKALEALLQSIEGEADEIAPAKAGMTKAQLKAVAAKSQQTKQQSAAAQVEERQLNELKANFQEAQRRQHELFLSSVYVNEPKELQNKGWMQVAETKYIRFVQFDGSDEHVNFFIDIFSRELSEPYSVYTHLFFIQGWPDLAIIALGYEGAAAPDDKTVGTKIGGIVSKVARKGPGHPLRAYVAMLAVEKHFRGSRIGSRLVAESVSLMKAKGCDYVYLETPTSNDRAMKLYTDLGFAKVKYLHRYYMDGMDAIRLKLWLRSPFDEDQDADEDQKPAVITV